MSYFIKLNGWSGNDKNSASAKFAKIFRLDPEDADTAMGQISNGLPWQFGQTISGKQSEQAKNYLKQLGFEVELLSPSDIEEADALDSFASADESDYSDYEDVPEKPDMSTRGNKPKQKSSKTGLLLLLLIIIAAVGLTQTQMGKDLLDKAITKSLEFIDGFSSEPQINQNIPATPPVQTIAQDMSSAMPTIKPLQGIAYSGETSMEYPVTLGGCRDSEEKHNLILMKADLEQTQKDFFCKDGTIANPKSSWDCKFTPNSKICPSKESYSCVRHYQCIPETPEFNKEKFSKEFESLENVENHLKTGLSNLTIFRGTSVDTSNTNVTTKSISNCYAGDVLREKLRRADLHQTQDLKFCKGGTIANPVGGWLCDIGQTTCGNPTEKYFICNRSYQCVAETPEYHRDIFQNEIKKFS